MAGDIEENVDITVEGADSLEAAAAAAESLDRALGQVRDASEEAGAAGAEAGAEISAGMDSAAASTEAAAKAAGSLRDKQAEAAAAADAQAASAGKYAAASKAMYADAERQIERIGTRRAAGLTPLPPRAGSDEAVREAEAAAAKMEQIEREIRTAGLSGQESGIGAGGALDSYAASLEKLKADLADAEPRVSLMNDAIAQSSRDSGIAATAMGNWHGALSDLGSGGDISTASAASRELDGALRDMHRSGDDALRTLENLAGGGGGRGGGGIFSRLSGAAGSAGSAISRAGQALGSGFGAIGTIGGKLQPLMMPAAWTALAAGISTIGPAVLSAGAGFASFGALAYPALRQVGLGLTNVTAARQHYQQAAAVARLDPTKANITAEQTALAQLKATYATMPPDIRKSVVAIQDLGHAWSEAGKKSGIQQDALKDIPKAIKDIKGLIPSITSLGKATAPVISGMLSGFGKFEKSSGFEKFIGNIKKQIPQAMPALHSLGNAVTTLASALFSPKNMKIGDSLLTNVSGMLKSLTPGAVDELGQVAKDMSGMAKWTSRQSKPGGVLQEAGRGWDDFWNGAGKIWRTQDRIGADLNKPLSALFGTGGKADAGKQVQSAISSWDKNLKGLKGGKADITAHLKVSDSGLSKAKSDMDSLHKEASKPAKTDVKARVEGADKAKSDLKGISSEAKKVTSAKAQVKVSTTGADSAKTALSQVESAAQKTGSVKAAVSVTVTGAQSATSALNQVGTAGSRMAAGVSAGASQATGAVTRMAASMRGAVSGLPAAFQAAGESAGAGMAAGISASTGEAVAAARSMAAQVEAAARTELQSKSPSKKMQKVGADAILGFILGLEGGKAAVQKAMSTVLGNPFKDTTISATIAKLKADVQAAYKGTIGLKQSGSGIFKGWGTGAQSPVPPEFSKISKTQELYYTKLLDADNKKLTALAKQRQSLLSQISAADQLASSVQSAAISGASVTGIAPNTYAGQIQSDQAQGAPGTSQNPYQNIQAGLKDQLSQIKQFRADIVKLKKEGLDEGAIKQLLNAGVTGGGLSTAQQILGEGSGAVRQISSLDKQIAAASKKLGITGANAAYESGNEIGAGLAAGLKASLKSVDSAMANIAKTLVTSLMTALGASGKDIKKALEKLDKELGISGGTTTAGGGKSGGARPGPVIEHRPPPGGIAHPALARPVPVILPPAASHGDTIIVPVTVNIDGKTVSKTTEKTFRAKTLQHARRNWRGGMQLPGRGV